MHKYLVLGEHSSEVVMVAVPINSNPTHPHILSYCGHVMLSTCVGILLSTCVGIQLSTCVGILLSTCVGILLSKHY